MMTPEEIETRHHIVENFRGDVAIWKMYKCIDSIEVCFHTGYPKRWYTSDTFVTQLVRNTLVDTKANELRITWHTMMGRGIDLTSLLPEELRK